MHTYYFVTRLPFLARPFALLAAVAFLGTLTTMAASQPAHADVVVGLPMCDGYDYVGCWVISVDDEGGYSGSVDTDLSYDDCVSLGGEPLYTPWTEETKESQGDAR
jgi:hypothetical protein